MASELIKGIQAAKKAYDEAVAKVTKADVLHLFTPVFEKYPGLKSFSWPQYTPYFNDGDSCTFSVYDVDRINEEDEDSEVDPIGWSGNKGPFYDAAHEIQGILNNLGEDLLLKLFDDHVRVTVTKTKIITEDYGHD